jgi:hypothetical protein
VVWGRRHERTLGIGTSAPAVSPRSSIILTMSIERSATWRSEVSVLALFHLHQGKAVYGQYSLTTMGTPSLETRVMVFGP